MLELSLCSTFSLIFLYILYTEVRLIPLTWIGLMMHYLNNNCEAELAIWLSAITSAAASVWLRPLNLREVFCIWSELFHSLFDFLCLESVCVCGGWVMLHSLFRLCCPQTLLSINTMFWHKHFNFPTTWEHPFVHRLKCLDTSYYALLSRYFLMWKYPAVIFI